MPAPGPHEPVKYITLKTGFVPSVSAASSGRAEREHETSGAPGKGSFELRLCTEIVCFSSHPEHR